MTRNIVEKFENTPEERGLVFGYVEEKNKTEPSKENKPLSIRASRIIKSNDIIELFTNNKYFGFNNTNHFLPNFLEPLGTFRPYIYSKITILSKNNKPISYNKTPVSFKVTVLNEDYYLQYLPKTNTFYLTNKPSYFLLLSNDKNKTEVSYDDNILIKCLDNSEYLLNYEQFIVTEPKKYSTFIIKESEHEETCKDLMPITLDPIQVKLLENTYQRGIDNYILKITNEKSSLINSIQNEINNLEIQIGNMKSIKNIKAKKQKLELENTIKQIQDNLEADIKKFKLEQESEFNKNKTNVTNTKKTKWDNELNALKLQMDKKCMTK